MSKLAKPEVVAKPTKNICNDFLLHDNFENFAISNAKKTYLNKNYQGMQKYITTCIVSLQNPRQ